MVGGRVPLRRRGWATLHDRCPEAVPEQQCGAPARDTHLRLLSSLHGRWKVFRDSVRGEQGTRRDRARRARPDARMRSSDRNAVAARRRRGPVKLLTYRTPAGARLGVLLASGHEVLELTSPPDMLTLIEAGDEGLAGVD